MSLRCFFLYDYFSPAFKAGGPIQSLSLLATQLGKELDIAVICSNRDADGTTLDVINDRWTEYAGTKVFYSSRGYSGFSSQLKDRHAILFINGIYSPDYNLFPILFAKGRKIVSVRGMLHAGALSQKKRKKEIYLLLWKLFGFHRRIEFHATTAEEAECIRKVFGSRPRIWVIPNLPKSTAIQPIIKNDATLILCSVALIGPMKNHHRVLEALKGCTSRIIYRIYGPVKDKDYWNRCKAIIDALPPNIRVEYLGEVEPYLVHAAITQCHVYIQPSLSENFGHSLYEALSCGRPVITSFSTPWQQLRANSAGINVDAEDVAGMAKAISFFSGMDEATINEWGKAANNYASGQLDKQKILSLYMDMFRDASSKATTSYAPKTLQV